jgi:multicomponent Na+:H+ antiporter subunit B
MSSVILRSTARPLLGAMLLFSLYVLLRGHNAPGGGFIGGLFATAGIAIHGFAFGSDRTERLLRVPPRVVLGFGLALAALSGIPAMLHGAPFLTHLWWIGDLAGLHLAVGTTLLFDLGVYLVVVGGICAILLELTEA